MQAEARAPIAELTGAARGSRRQVEKALARLIGANRDARALFMDDHGELRPEAARLLGRLAQRADLKNMRFDADPHHLYFVSGQREIVMFLAEMLNLDVRRLHELQTRLEQSK